MAFDPNFPPDHSQLIAAPYRNQFNALKALYDAQQTTIEAQQAQIADLQAQITAMPAQLGGAKNVDDFTFTSDDISDPPQKVEVEDLQANFGNLVQALKH